MLRPVHVATNLGGPRRCGASAIRRIEIIAARAAKPSVLDPARPCSSSQPVFAVREKQPRGPASPLCAERPGEERIQLCGDFVQLREREARPAEQVLNRILDAEELVAGSGLRMWTSVIRSVDREGVAAIGSDSVASSIFSSATASGFQRRQSRIRIWRGCPIPIVTATVNARQIPPYLRSRHARLLWMTSRGLAAANHLGDPDRCVGLCAAR